MAAERQQGNAGGPQSEEQPAGEAQSEVEALRADLDALRADLARLADRLGAQVRDSVREAAEELPFKEQLQRAKAQGEETVEQVVEKVQSHPLAGLAIAFGTGFILAALLGRGGGR